MAAFATDTEGTVWVALQDGLDGPLTAWQRLGGQGLFGSLTATASGDRSAMLIAADGNGTLRAARYDDGTLSGWSALGGSGFTSAPTTVLMPGQTVWVFARDAEGRIVSQWQGDDGAFPGDWSPVGDFVAAGAPSAIVDPVTGRVAVTARGTDGGIYWTMETAGQDTGVWEPWQRLPESDDAVTDPAAAQVSNAAGNLWIIVYRDINDGVRLYERRMVPSSGSPAASTSSDAQVAPDAAEPGTPEPTFTGHTLPPPPAAG